MNPTQILLLHGAIGSNTQFEALKQALSTGYEVYAPNFPGHGDEPAMGELSMHNLVAFTTNYINEHQLHQPIIFGYSMGGYIACLLALKYPELVGPIITLATKFHWDKATAAAETKMLHPETLEQKVPKFAEALAQRHGADRWKILLQETAAMLRQLGDDPMISSKAYAGISTPCLLLAGDRDKMVSVEETLAVYRNIPNAQFSVLPATPHPIEQAPIGLLVSLINEFVGSASA